MSRAKTKARQLAVQAMYQWSLSKTDSQDTLSQFKEYETWKKVDEQWFVQLIKGVPENILKIDESLKEITDRPLEQVDLVELALLRLGAYELLFHIEVPYKVVLNEYINSSKMFGSVKSHAYINATLDKLAKTARKIEVDENIHSTK